MGLLKKPRTCMENADVIHGLKNSLGNSFSDPSYVSGRADPFHFRTSNDSKSLSLTFPKEIKVGLCHFEVNGCTKLQTHVIDLQYKESAKEFLMQTEDKNAVIVRNEMNKMRDDAFHVGQEERLNHKVLSDVERKFAHSLFLVEKKDVENRTAAKKELNVQYVDKSELKLQNAERKNVVNCFEGKNSINEDGNEETTPKEMRTGSGWNESDEKGTLDALSAEKILMVEDGRELVEKDDGVQCSRSDGMAELKSSECVLEIEEISSLCEKWEFEVGEKVKISEVMTPDDKEEKVEILDSENTNETDECLKVANEDLSEKKNCLKIDDTVPSVNDSKIQHNTAFIWSEIKRNELEENVLESEHRDPTKKGQQIQIAVKHLFLQITGEKIGITVSEMGNDTGMLCPTSGRSSEILGSFRIHGGNVIATESCPYYSWICVSSSPAEPVHRKALIGHGDDKNGGNTSGSFGDQGYQGSPDGMSPIYSRTGGSGGGNVGGSGGSGQGGDDDRNGRDQERRLDFSDGAKKGKAKKKLKKKCRLEHGFLTKEQISMLIGGFMKEEHLSFPDELSEFLKCFDVCFANHPNARIDCESCRALRLLLTHTGKCSVESCGRCDIIFTLYFLRKNGKVLPPGASLSQDVRRYVMKMVKDDLADRMSSETSSSGTGSEDDGPSSSDADSCVEETFVEELGFRALERERIRPSDGFQGPPVDGSILAEPQGQPHNYPLLTDPHFARTGSITYGTKDLVRNIARQLNFSADNLRDSCQNYLHVSGVGVILHYQKENLSIKNSNYEPDKEWNLLTEALGTGVSGSCFVGNDIQTKFAFCVKRIPIHKFYADEVLIWLDMEHQDIAEFYGIIAYNNFVYILQELITGHTLKELISTKKALDAFEALTYLQHLLTLLEYLEIKGVIHNDIKADNLLLREPSTSTRLVLIDFGLANRTSYVNPGIIPTGSQTQWSPEKAASEGYGFPADLWAAVAVFVHMLSGFPPWCVRFKNAGYLHYIIKHHSPPLEDVPRLLPPEVHSLIVDGWTVDPDARPTASKLLRHEAFKLLDSYESSADLFTRHLSSVESPDLEILNADEILNDSSTEELISLVQQRFFINENLSSGHQRSSSITMASGFTAEERPFYTTRSSMFHTNDWIPSPQSTTSRVMHRLEEETLDSIYKATDSSVELAAENRPPKTSEKKSFVSRITENNLTTFPGLCLMAKDPPGLTDFPKGAAMLNPNQSESASVQQSTVLHRVDLIRNSSRLRNNAERLIMESAPIPVMVEDFTASSDEENDDGKNVLKKDEKEFIDNNHQAFCIPSRTDESPMSLGTTVRMYLGNEQVYCIHLHPGRRSTWSEIFKRASTEIHGRNVVSFTAEISIGGQTKALDISSIIPSEHELLVVIVPVNSFQEHGWTWRVEDDQIIYHETYQGEFWCSI